MTVAPSLAHSQLGIIGVDTSVCPQSITVVAASANINDFILFILMK